ncbi:MAG TPA: thiamine biosynthesis protein [Candidatus Nitrosotalea sp.]|nr:thiamine biosynthesis protein [Candidatus Nitrosotalea sp.]
MGEKTVLVVFPSVFSLNKLDALQENVAKILKIKKHDPARTRKNESLVVVETADPVLASSTLVSLFGIEQVAIAKEVECKFASVLEAITTTSMNLLLKGDKFYVKVGGKSPDFVAKDLEVAATASLIEKSSSLEVQPGSESNHTKMLYTHITKSHAYVCIFVDRGLGGVPYNSQGEAAVCCIYDELSALSCLQTIRSGFEVKIVVAYSGDPDLLRISKMVNRLLLSIVEEKVTLYFCRMHKVQDTMTRILVATRIAKSVSKSKKIRHVALPILPLAFPAWFIEENLRTIAKSGLVPWLPLEGMDSSILENSKQLGLEKYMVDLENLCKSKFAKKAVPEKKVQDEALFATKNLKSVTLTVGPKNVYDMIDSLRTNH